MQASAPATSTAIGVAKAYVTLVGTGPARPTELAISTEAIGGKDRGLADEEEIRLGDHFVEIGREYGTVTGRRRRPGWFDAVMLRQAVRLNSLSELAITKLDILDGLDTVKVCVAYDVHGERVTHLHLDESDLHVAKPIYEELPGWDVPLSQITETNQLPPAAEAYTSRSWRSRWACR